MTQPLFLPIPQPDQEKSAAAMTKLPPDAQQWPQVLYQKVVETLPELGEFDLNIAFDHQDLTTATALGAVLVKLKAAPSLDIMGQVRPNDPSKTVRIPLLILHGDLFPMDLLVVPGTRGEEAKTVPLTSRRLRTALFREDIFQGTSQAPGPSNLAGLLYPSSRDTFYGGNSSINQKQASAKNSLLEDLLCSGVDKAPLMAKVASLPAFARNNAAAPALDTLLNTYEKQASADWKPTTIHVIRIDADNYAVKTANPACWEPRVRVLSRAELIKEASPEEVATLDTEGDLLASEELEGAGEVPEVEEAKVISIPCVASVQLTTGEDMGVVIPTLIDLTGQPLPISLYLGAKGYALAPEVYGHVVSTAISSPGTFPQPSGFGAFLQIEGGVQATVPMKILSTATTMQGVAWLVATEDGSQMRVDIVEGLRKPFESDGILHLPETFEWMPLPAGKKAELAPHVEGEEEAEADPLFDEVEAAEGDAQGGPGAMKAASARKLASRRFTLRYHGPDQWEVGGRFLEKVGGRYELDTQDTMLLLAVAGIGREKQAQLMVKAATQGPVRLQAGVDRLTSPSELLAKEAEKRASVHMTAPLPKGLDLDAGLKFASEFQDGDTIDSLLGLSLLTPDTLSTFVTHLPELEKVQGVLCDALMASRLGLKAYDEAALEKAVQGMEAAIEGTYLLRFQQGAPSLSWSR